MAFGLPTVPELDDPLLGFRFGVFFLGKLGVSHPLDFRFQSISGLEVEVSSKAVPELGKPNSVRMLPDDISYKNLVLERGMPVFSTLRMEVQNSFQSFQFQLRDVLVSVLDENALPLNSWLFSETYPVKWSLSGIDANSGQVIVERLELAYAKFKPFSL